MARRGVSWVAWAATLAATAPGVGLTAAPAWGQEVEDATPPPGVELDALLRLPKHPAAAPPRAAGATRKEWQERFAAARSEVEAAQGALEGAQRELEELASDSSAWKLTAPGGAASPDSSPLSYKLRQEIRQHRDDLAAAEGRLNELRIEANLAGVPEEWQNP